MTVIKKVIGSCFFEYISEFDSEEKALNGLDGTFKEVKIDKLRTERVKITKENDDSKSQRTPKAKG
jgi:hypothetical protein